MNLSPSQFQKDYSSTSDESEEEKEILTDQSEYDKSASVKKGRFVVRNIPNELRHEYRDEPGPLTYEISPDQIHNFIQFAQPDRRNSSEYNGYIQNHPNHTEYSLRERSETGTSRNLHPLIPDMNAGMISNDENLGPFYAYRNDNFRTPMFTNGSKKSQQNMMLNNQIPAISFENITENKEDENTNTVSNLAVQQNYSDKEEKGSPRNSSYYINSGYDEYLDQANFQSSDKSTGKNSGNPQRATNIPSRPVNRQLETGIPINSVQNYRYLSQSKCDYWLNFYFIVDQQTYLSNLEHQNQLQFMNNTFKNMQEFQSMQFQIMMNSHTQLMNKLIDKVMGSDSSDSESSS